MCLEAFMRTSFWLCAVVMVGVIAVGCEIGGDGDDECLTSTPCVDNSDCDSGQHCNTELFTPMCQVLYCGEAGTQCSENELCLARVCDGDFCAEPDCVPDCGSAECGLDPLCGKQSCGTCGNAESCRSGECKIITAGDGMVLIPAGAFWMGCNETKDTNCLDDEKPYHEVTLSAYKIDMTEVTVEAYRMCVTAAACSAASDGPSHCNWAVEGRDNHPINCVTWDNAKEYCEWAGKRLPTEAEWEKAARGTDGRKYPWGNVEPTCDYAVMYGNGDYGCGAYGTWEVCSKSPAGDSPYDLCDMAGNVWEWVSDGYASDYYTSSPASNPTGPSYSTPVFRGGCWDNFDDFYSLRASNRDTAGPMIVGDGLGFRCAKDAP